MYLFLEQLVALEKMSKVCRETEKRDESQRSGYEGDGSRATHQRWAVLLSVLPLLGDVGADVLACREGGR